MAKSSKEYPVHAWSRVVWHGALARQVDQVTSQEYGIAAAALMETAGRAVARAALTAGADRHMTIVLAGKGNNGGDGLVAARVLFDAGVDVRVFIVGENHSKSSELFNQQYTACTALRIPMTTWQAGQLQEFSRQRVIIIDSVLGLGFRPPLNAVVAAALQEAATLAQATVIAVDTPSGLTADDGAQTPCALTAQQTITFGAPKPLHVLMPSAGLCGHVQIEEIGFPRQAVQSACQLAKPYLRVVQASEVLALDPWQELAADAHKYDRGQVLVIGGSAGKIGAPILAGLAALRSGAGWSTLAIPTGGVTPDMLIPPELTIEDFFDGRKLDEKKFLATLKTGKIKSIVIGPGWTEQHLTPPLLEHLLDVTNSGVGIVLDAGATHDFVHLFKNRKMTGRLILTPHPGEWSKMAKSELSFPLEKNAIEQSQEWCQKTGVTLVFKNAAPMIIAPNSSEAIVCTAGDRTLARAGSGDVLAGAIAAHLAIGSDTAFAVARAYTLVARAAQLAARELGEDAVLPTDTLVRLGIAGRV